PTRSPGSPRSCTPTSRSRPGWRKSFGSSWSGLMGEWRDLPIKQLGRVITGATPKSSEPDSWGDEIDFITPTDQREGLREARAARRLSSVGAERWSSRLVPAGSTCFTCIGATIGKTSLTTRPAVTNQQINSVIPNPASTDCEFLYSLLTYHAADLARIA